MCCIPGRGEIVLAVFVGQDQVNEHVLSRQNLSHGIGIADGHGERCGRCPLRPLRVSGTFLAINGTQGEFLLVRVAFTVNAFLDRPNQHLQAEYCAHAAPACGTPAIMRWISTSPSASCITVARSLVRPLSSTGGFAAAGWMPPGFCTEAATVRSCPSFLPRSSAARMSWRWRASIVMSENAFWRL